MSKYAKINTGKGNGTSGKKAHKKKREPEPDFQDDIYINCANSFEMHENRNPTFDDENIYQNSFTPKDEQPGSRAIRDDNYENHSSQNTVESASSSLHDNNSYDIYDESGVVERDVMDIKAKPADGKSRTFRWIALGLVILCVILLALLGALFLLGPKIHQQRDACESSPCGPLSNCKSVDGSAICTCQKSTIGEPPHCRPECSNDSDCPTTMWCQQQKCKSICPEACGTRATCNAIDHKAVCVCEDGYIGDPHISCIWISPSMKQSCTGDLYFNGKAKVACAMEFFKFFTMTEAKQKCQSMGGRLPDLRTIEVNDYYQNLTNAHSFHQIWIDVTLGSDGNYYSGGLPLTFSKWHPGEPNNVDKVEHCAELHSSGFWFDKPCTDRYPAICEKIIIE